MKKAAVRMRRPADNVRLAGVLTQPKNVAKAPGCPEETVSDEATQVEKMRPAEFLPSREVFQNVIDGASSSIYGTDLQGKILFINERLANRCGVAKEMALGRVIYDFYPKELVDVIFAWDRKVAAEGILHRFEESLPRMGKTGYYISTKFPIRDGEGRIYGVGGVINNITEFTQAQELIKYQAKSAELMAEVTGQLLAIDRPLEKIEELCLKVMKFLDCQVFLNYLADEERRELSLFVCAGIPNEIIRTVERLNYEIQDHSDVSCASPTTVQITNAETIQLDQLRRSVGVKAYAAYPMVAQNKIIGMLSFGSLSQDCFSPEALSVMKAVADQVAVAMHRIQTEKALAESEKKYRILAEELGQIDQRKDQFLAVLSHELRNPLSVIKNCLTILDRITPCSDQAKQIEAVANRQINQLAHLVDDLLDITRINQNKIQLRRRRLELNQLTQRTIEDHRALFDQKEIRLEIELAMTPIYVNGDETRLAQVLGNLLLNAAKFTANGGSTRVAVTVAHQANQALIRVSDTGIGMDAALQARLFQPFMQADASLDRNLGGLGLGLALSRGLVELHGGTVSAFSAGPGQGAEFTVCLPLAKESQFELADDPRETIHPIRRVLIIDDNIDLAGSLCDLLQLSHHEVAVAYNGPDGVAKARAFQPEILLCDIGLPGMDGYQVAQIFRQDESLKDVFLVALTGYAQATDRERVFAAGFARHLGKPVDVNTLEQLLDQIPPKNPNQ